MAGISCHSQHFCSTQAAFPCHQFKSAILLFSDGDWLEQTVFINAAGKLLNIFLIKGFAGLHGVGVNYMQRQQQHLADRFVFGKQLAHKNPPMEEKPVHILSLAFVVPQ